MNNQDKIYKNYKNNPDLTIIKKTNNINYKLIINS